MYRFKSRIRYSEIDEGKRITPFGIVNYFQDCSSFHSEEVGEGLMSAGASGKVWLLTFWQICVERYAAFQEEVEIATWPYAFKGFLGYRNYTMRDQAGNLLAGANAIWALMDAATNKPAKITDEIKEKYELEPRLDMDYTDRKILVPQDSMLMEGYPVRQHHIDSNHHVNNSQYIQMAQDCIPGCVKIRQIRVAYKQPAVAGNIIVPMAKKEGSVYTVTLCDPEKKPYAVVEFS